MRATAVIWMLNWIAWLPAILWNKGDRVYLMPADQWSS